MVRACLFFLYVVSLTTESWAERVVTPFDRDWRFTTMHVSGSEELATAVDDWQRVDLPHDWAIAGPFDKDAPARGEGGFLPTGIGRYEKHFRLPEERRGRRVFVEFDGVMANSDVWINGQHLGHRPNGYVSFYYDITDHVRYSSREDGGGEENILAVRCDTSEQVASRWYTGSGIYRHVRLVEVDTVHIVPWGVAIMTPRVTKDAATTAVTVTVENGDSKEAALVSARVLDSKGQEVASTKSNSNFWNDGTLPFELSIDIEEPRLWDIDDPQMYVLESSVVVDGKVVDQVTTPFGIRSSEFKSDTGYWLNGRNVKIKGVCLHHDGGAVGAAVPLGVWEYRLARLKELGVNAIRTAHNPVAPEFLDLCDSRGFLVMDEFFDCWTVAKRRQDYHKHFEEWSHRDMSDTILRDRNHPSVILYSVGNEIHDTPKEELAKRILKGLVEVCHDTDPTRPVTQALFRPNVSHDYDNGLADMLDVIGTNYRDPELLDAWRDKPTRKIIGTEQGHERRIWLAARDNAQHAGQFLWVGVDYLGESRRWPVTTFNAGLLDRTGHPHPRGRERQSWWSDKPMVAVFRREAPTEDSPTDPGYEAVEWKRRQVLFDDWTPRNADPHKENVEIYSNCVEVELTLNGTSLGTKELREDAGPRNWDVDFSPGELVAIGRNGGEEAARETLKTAGEADRLELMLSRERLAKTWDDVAIVEARIVDENGTVLPRADQKVSFGVPGNGQVIAVDNGSVVSHEPFQATERQAFHGRCIAIVRATADTGEINITASAEGLKPGSVTIQIVSKSPPPQYSGEGLGEGQ
jgi:beta-galactosidase